MGHTKEPWIYTAEYGNSPGEEPRLCYYAIRTEQRDLVASTWGTKEADARRIVACVNACDGIPTDDLEMSPHMGLFHLVEFSNIVVQQRDELLSIVKAIEIALLNSPASDVLDENSPIRDAIRDAISKAEAA